MAPGTAGDVAPATFEVALEAPDDVAPAAFEVALEAPDDFAIATLEMAPETADNVAVLVGTRALLITELARVASPSSAIIVEFAVLSVIRPIIYFANFGLNFETFDYSADICG